MQKVFVYFVQFVCAMAVALLYALPLTVLLSLFARRLDGFDAFSAVWLGCGLTFFLIFANAERLPGLQKDVSRTLRLQTIAGLGLLVALIGLFVGFLYGLCRL